MKKTMTWLLILAMILSLVPATVFAEESAGEIVPSNRASLTSETNTGKLNRIPYNNPDAIVDLDAGFQPRPFVADENGDGYLDLMVAGTATNYPGMYVFYGDANSKNDLTLSKAYRVESTRTQSLYPTYTYDSEGKYSGTTVFNGDNIYPDFVNTFLSGPHTDYGIDVDWPMCWDTVEEGKTFYSLVDYDGDGLRDLICGLADKTEYGWNWGDPPKFDSEGVWGDDNQDGIGDDDGDGDDDPRHGWVLWAKNHGTEENPDFSGTANVVCVNNDPNTPVDNFSTPSPSFHDWDGDGDLDMMCGSMLNDILYYQNVGTRTEPCYAEGVAPQVRNSSGELEDLQMELCLLVVQSFDWNQDGLMDLIVGEEDGRVCLVKNTDERTSNGVPIMEAPAYFKQPADHLKNGIISTPYSLDWDNDGDEDLFVTDSGGFFSFIENITFNDGVTFTDQKNVGELTKEQKVSYLTDPSWAPPLRLTDPEGTVIRIQAGYNGSVQGPAEEIYGYTSLSMGDWDDDGDQDIVAGSILGKIVWLENLNAENECVIEKKFSAPQPVRIDDPTPEKCEWDWWDPEPYELVGRYRSTPFVIDLNEDGLDDLLALDCEGYLAYYEKMENGMVKTAQYPFIEINHGKLKMDNGNYGATGRRRFTVTDWDGDGDLDIIRGSNENFDMFLNQGIGDDGNWHFKYKGADPSRGQNIGGHEISPCTCDWNLDGIPDLILGGGEPHYFYWVNTDWISEEEDDETEEFNAADHLMAHWDFEGDSSDTQLADKAKNDSIDDKLSIKIGDGNGAVSSTNSEGSVTVAEGVATITGTGVLYAADSTELSPTEEMTIYFRAKLELDGTADTALIDKRSFSRSDYSSTFGSEISTGQSSFGIYQQASFSDFNYRLKVGAIESGNIKLTDGEWREFAYVISKDPETKCLTQALYQSTGERVLSGGDFSLLSSKTTELTAILDSNVPFLIGNYIHMKDGGTRHFDEVRVYDVALTMDQLATEVKVDEAAAVNPADHLMAHWDFEGDSSDTQLADKAKNDSIDDKLSIKIGDGNGAVSSTNSEGSVTVAEGVATITGTGVLYAADSTELSPTEEMTIYFRAKLELDGTADTALIDKRSFSRSDYSSTFGSEISTGQSSFGIYQQASFSDFNYALKVGGTDSGNINLTGGEWREFAYVISKDPETECLTQALYQSTGERVSSGEDFKLLRSGTTELTAIPDTDVPFLIGNYIHMKDGGTRHFDEVRVYDVALTMDQLAAEVRIEDPNFRTVTFNSKGGSEVENQSVLSGRTAVRPSAPSREGYIFAGWYADESCSTVWDFDVPVTENVTLYAAWIEDTKTFEVTFDLNEHGESIGAMNVKVGSLIAAPENPEEVGFVFGGWYSDEALTEEYVFGEGVMANTTLYAKWSIKTHTVVWKDEDYTRLEVDTVNYGDTPTYDGETPTKAADELYTYTFAGWSPSVSQVTGGQVYIATYSSKANVTVTGVTLDKDALSLVEGESDTLNATVVPADAANGTITWSTSDSAVATVSNGTVTAVAPGTANITVTTADGNYTATCKVTVTAVPVPVTGVTLDKGTLSLIVGGETATLTATVAPVDAANKTITWSTSDSAVATVSNGTVTAVAPGTANISVTTADGNYTATCKVTVTAASTPVTGVTLDTDTLSLTVGGETATLTATVVPDNATTKTVEWSSDNSAVATVANGIVTPIAAGTVTITVTTEDGGFTDTCEVTVAPAPSSHATLSALTVSTGTLSPAFAAETHSYTMSVENGVSSITVTATAADGGAVSGTGATALSVGSNTITLTVTSENGENTATYTITVTRASAPVVDDDGGDDDDDGYTGGDSSVPSTPAVPEAPKVDVDSPTVDTETKTDETTGSTTTTETKQDGTVVESTTNKDGSSTTTASKTETTTNKDGSTTTTTATNTSTTTAAGDKVTEEKVEQKVENKDGSTTTTTTTTNTTTDAAGKTTSSQTVEEKKENADGSATTTTNTTTKEADGTTTKSETVAETTKNADGTETTTSKNETTSSNGSKSTTTVDETGKVEAAVTVSSTAVNNAAKADEAVTLPMPEVPVTSDSESAPTVEISMPASTKETKVEIPVTNPTAGTVAIIVHADGTEEIVTGTVATEDGVVLTVSGDVTVKIVDNSQDYGDVNSGDWYDDATKFVSSREIMSGTGDNSFSPDAQASRGMIAVILHSLENDPEHTFDGSFDDVGDTWYTDSVHWAAENGIMSGTGDGSFGADDSVTREQLATTLYSYADKKGIDTNVGTSLTNFSDGHSTSDWAKAAMEWAVHVGLFSGKGDGILDPNGTATRAEIAQILMAFCSKVAQ